MIKHFGFIKARELIKLYTNAYKIPKLHVARKPPNMNISEDATLHSTGDGMQVKKKNTVKESEDTGPHERQRVI
jgi:hypothetical protein